MTLERERLGHSRSLICMESGGGDASGAPEQLHNSLAEDAVEAFL